MKSVVVTTPPAEPRYISPEDDSSTLPLKTGTANPRTPPKGELNAPLITPVAVASKLLSKARMPKLARLL